MRILQNVTKEEMNYYLRQPNGKEFRERVMRDGIYIQPGDKEALSAYVAEHYPEKEAAFIEISDEGKSTMTSGQKERAFSNINDLCKHLFSNYEVVKGGMVNISSKYLRSCVKDDEKLQSLYEILSAADANLKEKRGEKGFQGLRISIGDDGEVTMESGKKTVGFNHDKRKRQLSAAATRGDMNAVLALLEQDVKELERGLKENACDAAEVEKAKKLLEQAKQKMAALPDRAPTQAEQTAMAINMLI
ncbi:MAG: hypothetical protein Q4D07_07965 [Selenomonadaceae bacterium]|nr:hypothetical protein [Selenomonadaceae bacterium]